MAVPAFNPVIENTDDKTTLTIKFDCVVDLNDDNTKLQFDILKEFFDIAIPNDQITDFFQILQSASDSYQHFYSVYHNKDKNSTDDKDETEQALKINLDTSDFDSAIAKADNLLQKLKEINSLLHSICNTDYSYSFNLSRR